MKSLLSILLFLLITASLSWSATASNNWLNRHAELLPADTLVTVTFSNLDQLITLFNGSTLQRDVFGLENLLEWASIGGSSDADIIEVRQIFHKQLLPLLDREEFKQRFHGAITLALLPLSPKRAIENFTDELFRSVVVIVTPQKAVDGKLLEILPEVSQLAVEEKNNIEIISYSFDDDTLYEAKIGSSWVVAGDTIPVERVMEFALSGQLSLRSTSEYKQADQWWQTRGKYSVLLTNFINIPLVSKFYANTDALENENSAFSSGEMDAVHAQRSIVQLKDGALHGEMQFRLDPDSLSPEHKRVIAAGLHPQKSLLKDSTMFLLWSGSLQGTINSLLNTLDVTTEDDTAALLLKAIGDQALIAIDSSSIQTPLFPLPRLALLVAPDPENIQSAVILQNLLSELLNNLLGPSLPFSLEGSEGTVWSVDPAADFQPAILMTTDFIYLATGMNEMQSMLVASKATNSEKDKANNNAVPVQYAVFQGQAASLGLRGLMQALVPYVNQGDRIEVGKLFENIIGIVQSMDRLSFSSSLNSDGQVYAEFDISPPATMPPPPERFRFPGPETAPKSTADPEPAVDNAATVPEENAAFKLPELPIDEAEGSLKNKDNSSPQSFILPPMK